MKIKFYIAELANGQRHIEPSLDAVMRTAGLHEAKGRLTKDQAIARAKGRGASLYTIMDDYSEVPLTEGKREGQHGEMESKPSKAEAPAPEKTPQEKAQEYTTPSESQSDSQSEGQEDEPQNAESKEGEPEDDAQGEGVVPKEEEGQGGCSARMPHPKLEELLARCRAVKAAQNAGEDGLYPMLVGPAGSGKTTAAREVSKAIFGEEWLDKFGMLSLNEESERSEGFGFVSPIDKMYKSTDFRKMYEEGGVFLLDEVDAANANALTALNAAISAPIASFPDGVVKRHNDFILIAAANTFGDGADGMYVGRNVLDAATKDRFQTLVWNYDWDSIRAARPKYVKYVSLIEVLSNAAQELNMDVIISPRAALFGPFLFEEGLSLGQVLTSTAFKGVDEDDVKTIFEEANVDYQIMNA